MSSRFFVESPQALKILPIEHAIPASAVKAVRDPKAIKGTQHWFFQVNHFSSMFSKNLFIILVDLDVQNVIVSQQIR